MVGERLQWATSRKTRSSFGDVDGVLDELLDLFVAFMAMGMTRPERAVTS
jgi:hypothetical protein